MKYVQKFNDHEDFRNKIAGYENLVSLCYNNAHIHFGQSDNGYENECFSIKILSGENITITIDYNPSLENAAIKKATTATYCDPVTGIITENANATTVTGNAGVMTISGLNSGDQIWLYTAGTAFRPYTTTVDSTTTQYGALTFKISDGKVSLQGNLMSILADNVNSMYCENNKNITNTTTEWNYMCYCMFKGRNTTKTLYGSTTTEGNDSIIYANNLILPLNALPTHAYSSMFSGCFSLKSIPKLPATTLGAACYYYMFYGCLSLEDISYLVLPATSLPNNCYRSMFDGCRSLKYPMKKIQGTASGGTGASTYNLYRLFYYCTSLEKAPKVELGTVGKFECTYMFRSCTSLKSIDEFSHTGTAGQYGFAWMCEYASSLAYFPTLQGSFTSQHHYNRAFADTSLEKIKINIPTLSQYQFFYAFRNCSKISYIDATAVKTRSNTACTNYWLNGAKNTTDCKLYTYHGTTWPTTSVHSYLSNWTVYDENGNVLRQP